MKKTAFIFGMATLLLASCSQDENTSGGNSAPNAIGFGTFVQKPTKGLPVNGIVLPDGGEFLVMANTDLVVPGTLNFMRQPVTYVSSLVGCTYSPTKYWPSSGSVNFFAVYPADIAATITPDVLGGVGQPNVSYTIPVDATKQKDLMLASAPGKTSGSVDFAFTHALTKIGFKAKLNANYDGAYICINTIEVGSMAGAVTFDAGENGDGTWKMTLPDETGPFTSTFSLYRHNLVNNGVVTSTTLNQLVDDNSYLMLAPVSAITAATNASVLVRYTVTYADGSVTENTATGSIDKANFAAGAAISINMTITLSGISFNSAVTDWGTEAITTM